MPSPEPVVIEVALGLAAPPEQVWPWLVDWEHLGEWMKEASGFEVIGSQREGVGVRARATVSIAGITTADTVVVSRWEPPHWLEIRHGGWVKGSGLMHCRPAGSGSYLWWRESLVPPGELPVRLATRLGLRTLAPVMSRVFARDLRELKRLVER